MKEGTNSQYTAAIWSAVDTTLEGSGELYIRNNNLAGIQTGNADLTINDGNYSITANTYGLSVIGGTLTINDGYLQMNCGIDTIDPSSVTVINGGTILHGFGERSDAGIQHDHRNDHGRQIFDPAVSERMLLVSRLSRQFCSHDRDDRGRRV